LKPIKKYIVTRTATWHPRRNASWT